MRHKSAKTAFGFRFGSRGEHGIHAYWLTVQDSPWQTAVRRRIVEGKSSAGGNR
jgi:hypothetical protein